MLKRMTLKNLTVFSEADLEFGQNLNVIIGENGAGKTHLLKMIYSVLAVGAEEQHKVKRRFHPMSYPQSRFYKHGLLAS